MFKNKIYSGIAFLSIALAVTVGSAIHAYAEEMITESINKFVTIDEVNFRTGPSTEADMIEVISPGMQVAVINKVENGWSQVEISGTKGFIKSEYIATEDEYKASPTSNVELLSWSEARNVFSLGVSAQIYDVRSGLTYHVKSFSNGKHADVEPVTKEDTAIMLKTYGGQWSWDTRPILVTIGGRTMAASINGMPHGGGVNNNNNMQGQVCVHFKESATHNGNRSHERDHQNSIKEAYNITKSE